MDVINNPNNKVRIDNNGNISNAMQSQAGYILQQERHGNAAHGRPNRY